VKFANSKFTVGFFFFLRFSKKSTPFTRGASLCRLLFRRAHRI
jgi:hypothetical protein